MQHLQSFQTFLCLGVSIALMMTPTQSSAAAAAAAAAAAVEPEFLIDVAQYNNMTIALRGVLENHAEDELVGNACAAVSDCYNCSNTYTCHWCSFDEACHARGSVHGCAWGTTCDPKPPKPPKENTTCASHETCADCSLASHLCHWCEHDNACHAIGSKYGCKLGVDCYSNDRCRRDEPEPFHRWIILEAPRVAVVAILVVGALLLACLSCCHFCFFNVKGAYDDLATISMAASRPPSVIGGTTFMAAPTTEHFYNTLETYPEADNEDDDDTDGVNNSTEEGRGTGTSSTPTTPRPTTDEEAPAPTTPHADPPGTAPESSAEEEEEEHPRPLELDSDPNDLLVNTTNNDGPTTPLLPSSARSFNGIPGMEEPRHMKALYRLCSCCYYLSILLVLSLVCVSLFFFPKPPVYNVCNDAVAWKNIIENMVALKLDASFEILVSVSNPNHLTVVLDKATGSFSFDGEPIGTYVMPAATAEGMAVTDMMLIAKVHPDKYQAVQLAQAYYRGKLVLNADFNARLRAPALFDVTYEVHMKDIDVFVNELGPRDLCHCPSWDDFHSTTSLAFFSELSN